MTEFRRGAFAGLILVFAVAAAAEPPPRRSVEGQVLSSDRLPRVCIRVAAPFHFVGRHGFTIGKVASGERFVFAETKGSAVRRLFIAQFEAFLPDVDEIYRYRSDDLEIEGIKFKHGVFAFSDHEAAQENPAGEAAATAKFLASRGLKAPDEWLVDRYATLGDATRKNEMLLFILEPLSKSGTRLKDLKEPESISPSLADPIVKRSRSVFEIVPRGEQRTN